MRLPLVALLVWVLAGLCLAGCADRTEETSMDLIARVQRLDSGEWLLTYEAGQPISGLLFPRGKSQILHRGWKVQTPGVSWGQHNGQNALLVAGRSVSRIQVRFSTDTRVPSGDYPFFTSFSDAGAVMFTGHLTAVPLGCRDTCGLGQMEPLSNVGLRLEFVAGKGERVYIGGDGGGTTVSIPNSLAGTFVYFGRSTPVHFESFSALLDPGLPMWLHQELHAWLPWLLEFYGRKTGYPISDAPFVYLSLSEDRSGLDRITGGVIGRQVRLSLSGSDWRSQAPEEKERFLLVLAHEIAHLWNAHLFHPAFPGDEWMHEGGADAFAHRALLEGRFLKPSRYRALQTEALNRCLVGLSGQNAHTFSSGLSDARRSYHCGALAGLLTEAAVSRQTSKGLFDFWSELFRQAGENGGRYSSALYLRILQDWGGDSGAVATIESLVRDRIGEPDRSLNESFKRLGLAVSRESQVFPRWYHELAASRALEFLLSLDCSGKSYFSFVEGGVRLIGSNDCQILKDERQVRGAGSYHIRENGVGFYDYIHSRCLRSTRVPLQLTNGSGTFEMRCEIIPARPQFLEFTSL